MAAPGRDGAGAPGGAPKPEPGAGSAASAATGNVCPPEASTDRRPELSFRAASEIAAVLMKQARMRNYRRVDAAGRLWSEGLPER